MRRSTQDLPSESVTRRAAGPGALAALEQRLIRLEPRGVWRPAAVPVSRRQGAPAPQAAARLPDVPQAAAAGRRRRAAASRSGDAGRAKAESAPPTAGADDVPRGARIGVISDNHGYLDPAVLEILAGVTHIIHAGDIVDAGILARLATVAPVTAVAGNMDAGDLGSSLPRVATGEVAGVRFVVGHKRKRLLRDLADGANEKLTGGAAPDLVIYGHDHVPAAAWVDGTLYLDPGSASSPNEEDDDPTVAIVEVKPAGLAVTFVPLERRDENDAEPTQRRARKRGREQGGK